MLFEIFCRELREEQVITLGDFKFMQDKFIALVTSTLSLKKSYLSEITK